MTENNAFTILIADDTAANLQLLSLIIKEQGYSVRGLKLGGMVMPSALQSKPDLILLDIMMPDVDGYEVCRWLKNDDRTRDIPVLFISALNSPIDKVKAFSSGGVDYITKPIQKEEVLARIKTHLALSNLRKELEMKNQWLEHEVEGRKKITKALILDDSRLEALLSLTQMNKSSEKEIADFALEEVVRLTGSKIGYLHLVSEDQSSLSLYAWSKGALKTCSAVNSTHYPIEQAGIWADCVRQRTPVIHNDYSLYSNLPEGHSPISRHMSIPVFDGELIVAVSGVGNKLDPYDDSDIRQITLFMKSLWEIIKRKRAEDELNLANMELQSLASLDGLTRIANRRRFDEYLKTEWDRQIREKHPMSLIMCDIDYFKQYNDTYGHQAGDDVLRQIANELKRFARRPSDLAARYGGEEFAIILPNTDATGAMEVATLLLEAVQKLNIPHEKSSAFHCVTLSIGVTTHENPTHNISCEALITKADQALYEAKSKGRNTIVSKF